MARYFMGDTRHPMRAQRSGSHGERRSSAVSEPCRLRRGEGYEACDDAMMDPSRTPPIRTKTKRNRPQKKLPCDRPAKPRPREWEIKGDNV
ncbi:hypothetical protein D1646_14005 [Pseudoflavonifractor sp. 60]|nr:hypothetical protein [Pseudoflavonifractor sp. 60]